MNVRPPEPDLGALTVQVGDRLLHLGDGARAHAGSLVQHPVDRGLAEAGLLGDLADPERMTPRPPPRADALFLRCF